MEGEAKEGGAAAEFERSTTVAVRQVTPLFERAPHDHSIQDRPFRTREGQILGSPMEGRSRQLLNPTSIDHNSSPDQPRRPQIDP